MSFLGTSETAVFDLIISETIFNSKIRPTMQSKKTKKSQSFLFVSGGTVN